ncbi:MAG: hypothetical protein IKJ39_10135 [Lachnospiraceae bacterium]|nr:hypothetical protein [Lachnospiraceae bacterium]
MGKEQFIIGKLEDSLYSDQLQKADEDLVYCELRYQRDRSSFAGMAFKITDVNDEIIVRKCEEKLIQKVSEYENLYVGSEPDYIESVKEFLSPEGKEYGLEIYFLIYSDIRSSQMVFKKLMEVVDKNVETIRGL